jgi:hypothetical protein
VRINLAEQRLVGVHRGELDFHLQGQDAVPEKHVGPTQDLQLAALRVQFQHIDGGHPLRGKILVERHGRNVQLINHLEQRSEPEKAFRQSVVRSKQ